LDWFMRMNLDSFVAGSSRQRPLENRASRATRPYVPRMIRARHLPLLASVTFTGAATGCGAGWVWHGTPSLEREALREGGEACGLADVIMVGETGWGDEAIWPALVTALAARPELEGVEVRLRRHERPPRGTLLMMPTFHPDQIGLLSRASGMLSLLTFTIIPGVVVADRRLAFTLEQDGCPTENLDVAWTQTTLAWLPAIVAPDEVFMAFADDKQVRAGDAPAKLAALIAPKLARLVRRPPERPP
jgi:hypothetical protein